MAKIVASVNCSHVPAIGAAWDHGKTDTLYWAPVFIRVAIHRMCRGLEFDLCEMAFTTYLAAKAYGKPFTAIPAFVMRQFPHALMVHNTVTTGAWARGTLATEYGVDLDKIT
jgi:4,5-dihydroxyphthalate decarboxylase